MTTKDEGTFLLMTTKDEGTFLLMMTRDEGTFLLMLTRDEGNFPLMLEVNDLIKSRFTAESNLHVVIMWNFFNVTPYGLESYPQLSLKYVICRQPALQLPPLPTL